MSAPRERPVAAAPLLDTALLFVGLLAGWQLLSLLTGAQVLTSPLATLRRLAQLMAGPDFAGHAIETGSAFVVALVISLAGGLVAGAALGAHRLSGEVAEPLLVGLYSIPKITLYPVVLLLFGLGLSAKIAFGAIHGIIPVILFTMNAVRSIPHAYLRAARSMRLTPAQTFVHVLVPATLPEIVPAGPGVPADQVDGEQRHRHHHRAGAVAGDARDRCQLAVADPRASAAWTLCALTRRRPV
jgi:NitT/TauT family transport system permease protein